MLESRARAGKKPHAECGASVEPAKLISSEGAVSTVVL